MYFKNNKVFYRNTRKLAFIWSHWHHKNQKTTCGTCLVIYISMRSCDTMYRKRESKSNITGFFYWLFVDWDFFLSYFFGSRLQHMFESRRSKEAHESHTEMVFLFFLLCFVFILVCFCLYSFTLDFVKHQGKGFKL